jgi:hypothetical protein
MFERMRDKKSEKKKKEKKRLEWMASTLKCGNGCHFGLWQKASPHMVTSS